VTYADNTSDQYAYTISNDSPWFAVVKAYADQAAKGLTLTKVPGSGEEVANDGTKYTVTYDATKFSAPDFAQYLYAYADDTFTGGDTATKDVNDPNKKTLTSGSVDKLELGYWFVTTTTGALCNLTTTDPVVHINDKNIVVFEKDVDDEDHTIEVGQTVTYTLTGQVPDTTGYTKYTYKVEDTMTNGLTFKKDVKIKFGNVVIIGTPATGETAYSGTATVPTVDYSTDNKFVVEFDMTKWQDFVNANITITYTAEVNENAIQHDEENNKATLTYSNNPNNVDSTDHRDDEEHLYSFNLVLDKYAVNKDNAKDTSAKLAHAKFVLYKEVSEDDDNNDGTPNVNVKYYYYYNTTAKKVEWVKEADLKDAANVATTPDKATNITTVETDANGAAEFDGLEAGTYQLLETKAPDGYNLLTAPIPVVLVATENTEPDATEPYALSATVNGETAGVAHTVDNAITTDPANQDNDVVAQVGNNSGLELPSTGGIGTTIFYVVGGLMVAVAGVMLITKKRMSREG
jgi:fimbrial isopeptide formation D2 family protein/LPXTG-motif cell wall-anchored protein